MGGPNTARCGGLALLLTLVLGSGAGGTPLFSFMIGPDEPGAPERTDPGCALDRVPLTMPLPTPLDRPVVFVADLARNAAFARAMSEEHLRARLGSEEVQLTSSNSFSQGEKRLGLGAYLDDLQGLSAGGKLSNESFYLFGGNYSPGWQALIAEYRAPPCFTCHGDNIAVSLGVGGRRSGVNWHMHGAGFSEVLHGRKRWLLLRPDSGLARRLDTNRSVASFVDTVLPALPPDGEAADGRPLVCDIGPGEVLYFPTGWHHATLNLDEYTAFASTFVIDE